jgi:hypothetical protein
MAFKTNQLLESFHNRATPIPFVDTSGHLEKCAELMF